MSRFTAARPTWFVRLALLRDPRAAVILARAYNDWVHDYCAPDRRRLYPCAILPLQSVEGSVEELRRVGVGYVLINGGGSGGGQRGRASLRRFAAEVMPHFLGDEIARQAAE